MKRNSLSVPKWAPFVTFVVTTVFFGFSCGSGSSTPPTAVYGQSPRNGGTAFADSVCGAPIFNIGRPLSFAALTAVGNMDFELREVHFRDVILRSSNEIELAYRIEMRMQLSADRFLVPVHSLACNEQNRPSPRARRLARTMIPVVGDLHLPSTRITVFDQASAESDLYNHPRISEITVSNGGYFSFNQNWAPYRQVRTISQYMDLLRYRSLFTRVELREMGDGWLGIYAEKNIGGERAQLMILLARGN